MSLLVIGTLAFDSIETPYDKRENALGGSATYFALAASSFTPVRLVGVVGTDFPDSVLSNLRDHGICTEGVEIAEGETFRWGGRYEADWNTRHTLFTHLNVFEHFDPKVPEQLWIDIALDDLKQLLTKIDGLVLNDEEARLLTGEANLLQAARKVLDLGPKLVVLKKGEHGAFLISEHAHFALPAYPVERVIDPTGAGDSFAGGFMGYLAAAQNTDPATLKRAMLYGTATASFCVEGFSVEELEKRHRGAIEERFNQLLSLVTL
jgi:sugar/nucleoside kinase (ribokinase family)